MTTKPLQCKKCGWHGKPTLRVANVIYVQAVCPKCRSFIKFVKRINVSEDAITKDDAWWDKIKATETKLRPAYILEKELSNLRVAYAALEMENEQMKDIIANATQIITDAMEREGIIEHVPEWMKE